MKIRDLPAKELLALWQKYARRGLIPTWDTPWGFSEFLKRVYLGEIPKLVKLDRALDYAIADEADEIEEAILGERSTRGVNRFITLPQAPLLTEFLKTVAPQGFLYASRGYHSLAFTRASQIVPFLADRWKGLSSYTVNLARSAHSFARVTTSTSQNTRHANFILEKGDRHYYAFTKRVLDLWLRKNNLPLTKQNWALAYSQNVCGIQVVCKVPSSLVVVFGGDSESHHLYEAEILIRSRVPMDSVVGVFVATRANLPDARLATEEERALYCLSKYYSCRYDFPKEAKVPHMGGAHDTALIHKYVQPDAPWITSVKAVDGMEDAHHSYESIGIPGKIRWYRVV